MNKFYKRCKLFKFVLEWDNLEVSFGFIFKMEFVVKKFFRNKKCLSF